MPLMAAHTSHKRWNNIVPASAITAVMYVILTAAAADATIYTYSLVNVLFPICHP